jgi:hypothetical protein
MKISSAIIGALATLFIGTMSASASSILVDAKSDIFLAGQTTVPTTFPFNSGASGPGAGQLPVAFAVTPGETLHITATGLVSCCLNVSPYSGPDGNGSTPNINGYGNVAGFNTAGEAMALVGVFDGTTTPWTPFFIGSSDTVVVPVGATTLYLGLPDALGYSGDPGYYNDNTGSFDVTISAVPEPVTWAMMLVGFFGLGLVVRSTRAKSYAITRA